MTALLTAGGSVRRVGREGIIVKLVMSSQGGSGGKGRDGGSGDVGKSSLSSGGDVPPGAVWFSSLSVGLEAVSHGFRGALVEGVAVR